MPEPATQSKQTTLFAFEEGEGRTGHRDPALARAQLEVLWQRLGGNTARLAALEHDDPRGWQFLLRYVTDGPLSIQWYDKKRPQLEDKQRRYNAVMVGIAVAIGALAFALPFAPLLVAKLAESWSLSAAESSTGLVDTAALLGVLGTSGAFVMRLSAQVVRHRRQAAVFHKASAALKEQLYRLESEWRTPPLVDPDAEGTRLHPEFAAALREAVAVAQGILAQERDDFFDTLTVDVNALTDNAVAVQESMSQRTALRTDPRHEKAQERKELQKQLSQALLSVKSLQAKIKVLEEELAGVDEHERADVVLMLREHRLALRESEQQVIHLQGELESTRIQ